MPLLRWEERSAGEIAALDLRRSVAVLPVAATEQHGPHLPTGTDSFIAEGILAEAVRRAPPELSALILPVLRIGASEEHASFAGTLTVSAVQLIGQIEAIGAGVAASGLGKLLLISSHGGNMSSLGAAALSLRTRHRMLAVVTNFLRLGLPEGVVETEERAVGVHGGLIETSIMLHLRPDLVAMNHAEDFRSLLAELAEEYELLRAYGPVGFGWRAGDLNPAGVVGNAAGASAETGSAIVRHQAEALLKLLAEIADFDHERAFGRGMESEDR